MLRQRENLPVPGGKEGGKDLKSGGPSNSSAMF